MAASRLLQRLRALRVRTRHRGLVTLGQGATLGRGVRIEVARGAELVVGDGTAIGERCRLIVRAGTLALGEHVTLGDRCAIVTQERVQIGAGSVLGDEVAIFDFDHRFDDPERAIRLQGLRTAPVQIDDQVRLGARACVLRGVRIGTGARVAPLAVVTRSVAAGASRGTPGGRVRDGDTVPAHPSPR